MEGALSDAEFPGTYQAELGYVWKALIRLGVGPADAPDVAQDVFVVAYRTREQYDPARPLRPWFFAIAARLAANHRRLLRHVHEVPEEVVAAAPGDDPEQAVAASQDRELVLKALDRLSEEQRTAFVMHELTGHSVPEMAAALDVPLNTLYSRLRLARTGFAAAVRELAGEPP